MKSMARKVWLWVLLWLPLDGWGQVPTIEIHHMDIGVGDATLIKVNTRNPHPYAILIDGGMPGEAYNVIGYLKMAEFGNLGNSPYVDLVIASHYDADHIGGLAGTDNHPGILWPGDHRPEQRVIYYALLDRGKAKPQEKIDTGVYNLYSRYGRMRRATVGNPEFLRNEITLPAPVILPDTFPPLDTTLVNLRIGGVINLGHDANNVPVRLRLIAANGRVSSPNNAAPPLPYQYVDVAGNLGIDRNNPGGYRDENNWGLAWVLEYGEFRYFSGGDMAGYTNAKFFDEETPVSEGLRNIYPNNPVGHVCAMKVNHHGSDEASNTNFLESLAPTAIFFSCASGHSFPRQEVIDRVVNAQYGAGRGLDTRFCRALVFTEMHQRRALPYRNSYISGNIKYNCYDPVYDPEPIVGKRVKRNIWEIPESPNWDYDREDLAEYYNAQVLGNNKILVYPEADNEEIDVESRFEIYVRSLFGNGWLMVEEYRCH
jgi:hypothetical protein